VILLAVRCYLRYGLSYRDVEELLSPLPESRPDLYTNHRSERPQPKTQEPRRSHHAGDAHLQTISKATPHTNE